MSMINKYVDRAQSFKTDKLKFINQRKEDNLKQVIAVLEKPLKKRTDDDLKLVVPYAKKITLFNEQMDDGEQISEDCLKIICQEMNF